MASNEPGSPISLPPAAAPTAPIAPKKPNRMVRLGLGCLGLIVIGCIGIGALALYENWQQEQNYNTGHAAYQNADCAAAVAPLTSAARGEPGTRDSDIARQAQAELQQCEALLAADALVEQGGHDAAVMGYSEILTKYPDSPLKDVALSKGQEQIASAELAALATPALCPALDTLLDQQLIATPDQTLPELLFACGQAYETEAVFEEALLYYDRFLGEYAEHPLTADVQEAYARATIAFARASGAGELPAPQAIGSSGEGNVTVIIQNDSPEPLNMVFSGPEVRVERLEACTECQKFSGDEPTACPELGPVGTYVMAPGDYEVVVKVSGGGGDVTPFRGTWTLEPGQEYSSCFYVVSGGS